MTSSRRTTKHLIQTGAMLALAVGFLVGTGAVFEKAQADSLVIKGPGMQVQERRGWFGRRSASYDDALGNGVEHRRGVFGNTYDRTSVFGNHATVNHSVFGRDSVNVHDSSGNTMVSSKRGWLGGQNTVVDGNSILRSVQNVINTPSPFGGNGPNNNPSARPQQQPPSQPYNSNGPGPADYDN